MSGEFRDVPSITEPGMEPNFCCEGAVSHSHVATLGFVFVFEIMIKGSQHND